ncbi:UNVERIFIED_CONTAM: hypothetical protein Slati_2699100 [Sesamum latifolium]|uniref:CCHC-type domain-containing protein n=1 Tax=Sesamum latifolium TaxID=2727402 RepID=A0AAW2VWI0_9LAMI
MGPCGACGQMGYLSQDCQVGNSHIVNEDANFVSHSGRSNFNPYSNTYNPGWRSHPNFSWSNNQQQGPAGHHKPRQVQSPQEKKSNIEDVLSKFITAADTQLQSQDARLQSQEASIRNIEVQIEQLMPSYAKFLKEVISNKRKWENGETVKLNEEMLSDPTKQTPIKTQGSREFFYPLHYRRD